MLNMVISGVNPLAEGLWATELTPDAILSLGRPQCEEAGPNVLFVPVSRFDEAGGTLEFAHGAARIVNLGTVAQTIIATNCLGDKRAESKELHSAVKSGDRALIREGELVGDPVAEIVAGLLRAVRQLDPHGEFVRHGTRRFINYPDNFVTIIPQPRIRDVRVVVRGSPVEFATSPSTLRKDQNGYSTFKVGNAKDLGHAISLLSKVRRKT